VSLDVIVPPGHIFTKLSHPPRAQTHFPSNLPHTHLQTAEEFLMALLSHLESSNFQNMTPWTLCPALIDRSGKSSFEQVSYDVLIELRMVAPTLLSKGPQHTQLFHRR
jgi:hypothetical protein